MEWQHDGHELFVSPGISANAYDLGEALGTDEDEVAALMQANADSPAFEDYFNEKLNAWLMEIMGMELEQRHEEQVEMDDHGHLRTNDGVFTRTYMSANRAFCFWYEQMQGGMAYFEDELDEQPKPKVAPGVIEPARSDGTWKPYTLGMATQAWLDKDAEPYARDFRIMRERAEWNGDLRGIQVARSEGIRLLMSDGVDGQGGMTVRVEDLRTHRFMEETQDVALLAALEVHSDGWWREVVDFVTADMPEERWNEPDGQDASLVEWHAGALGTAFYESMLAAGTNGGDVRERDLQRLMDPETATVVFGDARESVPLTGLLNQPGARAAARHWDAYDDPAGERDDLGLER